MKLRTTDVLHRWRPGSGDWNWATEWADIMHMERCASETHVPLFDLIGDIAAYGIQTPILLGDDGRVWDGHHRLLVARLLGIEEVPVEYGGSGDLARLSILAHEQGHFDDTRERLAQPAQVNDRTQIQARLTELQERCGHEH